MPLKEILFLLLLLAANTIQTVSGFAGAMITVPIGRHIIGLDPTTVIVNLLGILPSVTILVKNYRYAVLKEALKIIAVMLAGMFLAQYLRTAFDKKYFMIAYGVLIIAVAVRNLISRSVPKLSRFWEYVILTGAGVIHGFFASGGSLLVFYCMSKFRDKDVFRATLSAAWIPLGISLFFMHMADGLVGAYTLTLALISLPIVVLSIILGARIYKKTDENSFFKFVNIVLIGCGVLMFV